MTSHDKGLRTSKSSSPSEEPDNRILRGYCGGYKTGKPMSMSTLGQGPSPRKNPSSTMGRTLLGHRCSQGQREQPATGSDTPDHFTEQEKY